MSGAAHDCVRACTHPQVKGPTRALFDAIAHFVPEGETTTPFIGMKKDLAPQARLHRRTVVTHLGILVEIGEVKVIDGGQGRPARYQIVHLDGARPMVAAPLPLRADLQPVPPRARPALPEDTTGDLFEPAVEPAASEQPAINLCTPITSTRRYLWSWITSGVAYLWSAITSTAQLVIGRSVLVIDDHKLAPPLEVLIDSRARDVQQLETTTTIAPTRDGPLTANDEPRTPRRVAHPWHAWCDGRVHVPKDLHGELLGKLGRFPNETAAAQEARLIAFYVQTCAELPAYESIGVTEFKFWQRAFTATFGTAAPTARAPTPRAVRRRATFGAGNVACPHDPMCPTIGACTERILRETREERERKSG